MNHLAPDEDHKIFSMQFSKIYACYLQKAEKKGRTSQEVDQCICWFTGYSPQELSTVLDKPISLKQFLEQSPESDTHMPLITGTICGYRIQEIQNSTMRQIRCLDKLIDELAKGKAIEKIIRN